MITVCVNDSIFERSPYFVIRGYSRMYRGGTLCSQFHTVSTEAAFRFGSVSRTLIRFQVVQRIFTRP